MSNSLATKREGNARVELEPDQGNATRATALAVGAEVMARTHVIWDEISERSGAGIEDATNHLMAALCDLHGCDCAAWFGAQRLEVVPQDDPMHGWRPMALQQLDRRDRFDAFFRSTRKAIETQDISLTTVRHTQMAGSFRATRLRDLVPESWFESEHYKRYLERDQADVVAVVFPVSERSESYFLFIRNAQRPRFEEHERDGLAYALRGIRWFHRHMLLFHGLLGTGAPLTVTERNALRCLLSGAADKDIAAELQIGLHRAREHVAALYRKFDVASRTELMALWLGRAG
jgi:DNA-binding CsgD family transcriptional regulator